jgi:glycosyltransferase involved in cell wall biosynthesis
VTTTEGSTKEYFGEYAKYVKPFDIKGLKNAILECLKSNFNNGIREHILSNFTWDKSAFQTYKAYENVLTRFKKNRRED